jgi:hypothetical protein
MREDGARCLHDDEEYTYHS